MQLCHSVKIPKQCVIAVPVLLPRVKCSRPSLPQPHPSLSPPRPATRLRHLPRERGLGRDERLAAQLELLQRLGGQHPPHARGCVGRARRAWHGRVGSLNERTTGSRDHRVQPQAALQARRPRTLRWVCTAQRTRHVGAGGHEEQEDDGQGAEQEADGHPAPPVGRGGGGAGHMADTSRKDGQPVDRQGCKRVQAGVKQQQKLTSSRLASLYRALGTRQAFG